MEERKKKKLDCGQKTFYHHHLFKERFQENELTQTVNQGL